MRNNGLRCVHLAANFLSLWRQQQRQKSDKPRAYKIYLVESRFYCYCLNARNIVVFFVDSWSAQYSICYHIEAISCFTFFSYYNFAFFRLFFVVLLSSLVAGSIQLYPSLELFSIRLPKQWTILVQSIIGCTI